MAFYHMKLNNKFDLLQGRFIELFLDLAKLFPQQRKKFFYRLRLDELITPEEERALEGLIARVASRGVAKV